MELDRWVKVFDILLPRSRAWDLVVNSVLRKFFHGLAILPKTIHEHIGSVLLEAFPGTSNYLADWSEALGSWTELDADELQYDHNDPGGQSPGYVQDFLHDKGFDNLYLHQWWASTSPIAMRDASQFFETDRVLVNDLAHAEKNWRHQFGDYLHGGDSQFVSDESVQFGTYDGWNLVGKKYRCHEIPGEYPLYYYIGAEVWPNKAIIYQSQLRYLLRLIYKTKPCHLRCILLIDVVDDPPPDPGPGDPDGDIQDTTWEDDDIIDSATDPDTLNDST